MVNLATPFLLVLTLKVFPLNLKVNFLPATNLPLTFNLAEMINFLAFLETFFGALIKDNETTVLVGFLVGVLVSFCWAGAFSAITLTLELLLLK